MTQSQYSLAWDSFKTNICSGFSALQQNGEFVDMTIAADGHFVKVHQVIVALASPYLKNLMASAPCQHPVIFLNNVPHKVLCYLLEYIYTGEVLVPSEYMVSFSNAASELRIKGLENIGTTSRSDVHLSSINSFDPIQLSGKRKRLPDIDPMQLPSSARRVFIKSEGDMSNQSIDAGDDSHDYGGDFMEESGAQDSDDDYKGEKKLPEGMDLDQFKASSSNLQYTVSIRGSLQIILNRYIYNLNSTTNRTGVRRWRCVHYRDNKCNAYVVTKGNMVVNRSHLHNHPFHDKKILAKIEKKAVFSAIDDVEAYKEREKARDKDDSMEEDSFVKDTKSG